MDKYFVIVLIFLIAGIGIAITREPFLPILFYTMLGGVIFVIIYSAMRDRRERRNLRKRKYKK